MPDRVQDLTNHRKVAVACKNYTDKEIKASEERILSIVARNNVDFIDHTDEATYRFTAPANAKLLMLQSIAGNSVKYSPSVASDNNATHIKTLPSTVYDLDVSKVEGVGYKVNQLVANGNFADSTGWGVNGATSVVSNNKITITANITSQAVSIATTTSMVGGNKYLIAYNLKPSKSGNTRVWFNNELTELQSTTANTNTRHFTFFTPTNTATSSLLFYLNRDGCVEGDSGEYSDIIVFNLTADFGSGNEPSTVSDCASAYLQRGINIYEYTPQQSSIKNNAFTGVKVEGANLFSFNIVSLGVDTPLVTYVVNNDNSITITNNYSEQSRVGFVFNYTGTISVSFNSNSTNGNFIISTLSIVRQFVNGANKIENISYNNNFISLYVSAGETVTLSNFMINKGSTAKPYADYVAPTTISVDLTTIKDSNNVSLFPSGKMMGNSSVADFVTPYNQESRWNEKTYSSSDVTEFSTQYENVKYFIIPQPTDYKYYNEWAGYSNFLPSKFDIYTTGTPADSANNIGRIVWNMGRQNWYVGFAIGTTLAQAQTAIDGLVIQYERKTYLTSNTDLTSLTGIQGQSLGTITLNNTGNVDMPNLISYNAIIKHALATAVKQDGFNIWDEQKELGGYDQNTGAKTSSSTTYRNVNPIAVRPNTEYYIKKENGDAGFVYYYDDNMNYISASYRNTSSTFTTPSNCYFINFTSMASTWLNETCINISNQDLNGTYKPYKASITRLLPNSEAKYSWGITTGVRNVRTYCDDEGNAVNEGSLDVGLSKPKDLTWNYTEGSQYYGNFFYAIVPSDLIKYEGSVFTTTYNILSNNYVTTNMNNFNGTDKTIALDGNTSQIVQIRIKDSVYNDGTMFKNHFTNDDDLYYHKATTDTETLDDFDFSFDCEEGDTFTIIGCELLQCYATYSFLIKEAKSNE